MADYWKSNDRYFCDFCKCWLSDNKACISFHENGKRHKANVAKRITDISRNSAQAEQEQRKFNADLRKMEEAAMRSYAQDISQRRDMTANSIGVVMDATTSTVSTNSGIHAPTTSRNYNRQQDPMRLAGYSDDENESGGGRVLVQKVAPEAVPNASLWVEGKSDEGHTYYWNVKTNESVWKAPKEGFLSYEEYEKINELALKQQSMQQALEAKNFRENVNEEVAKYNREKLKKFRKPEDKKEKQKQQEIKASYKTEEEANTPQIGAWTVVEHKPPPEEIDWELPKVEKPFIPPIDLHQPSAKIMKRFTERTVESLDPDVLERDGVPATFKKRKFAAKGNVRQRLDD